MALRDFAPTRARAGRQLVLACVLATVTALAIVLRIAWVRQGILYGSTPVSQADLIVNALVVATVLQAVRAWHARAARVIQPDDAGAGAATTWPDLLTQVTGLIGLLGVVIALTSAFVNLSAPATPPDAHGESCEGVRVWDADYVATNEVTTGVNTREGPSRSFVVNGRFPGDCGPGGGCRGSCAGWRWRPGSRTPASRAGSGLGCRGRCPACRTRRPGPAGSRVRPGQPRGHRRPAAEPNAARWPRSRPPPRGRAVLVDGQDDHDRPGQAGGSQDAAEGQPIRGAPATMGRGRRGRLSPVTARANRTHHRGRLQAMAQGCPAP